MVGEEKMRTDLTKIDYKYVYRKDFNNSILNDLLIPAFKQSKSYDRISGYFKSSVFEIYWDGLKDFIKRGGKIRILCSYAMDREDILAIHEGDKNKLSKILYQELEDMLNDEETFDRLKLLSP